MLCDLCKNNLKTKQTDLKVVVMHEQFVYDIEIDLMTVKIAALLSQQPTNLIPAGDYASLISDLFIFSSHLLLSFFYLCLYSLYIDMQFIFLLK